jgi:hypothetical protein
METKEVALVKGQATKALAAANDLVIANDQDLPVATELLAKIKQVGKLIKERKEEITKPLNAALVSARELFKPIETSHAEAEAIIKRKVLSYQDKVETERAAAAAKIAARVEKGTMRTDTAMRKMDDLQEVQTKTSTASGTVSTRTIKKVRIINPELLPRDYLLPDNVKINRAALFGVVIPGVEVYEEKTLATNTR